jgi:hypothetical protein
MRFLIILILSFWALACFSGETNTIYQTNLYPLLQKHITDKEMREFLSHFRNEPEVSKYSGGKYYYGFKKDGISLSFNKDDILQAIFLYNQGTEGFTQYAGLLPYGLTFNMTKSEVEKILGTPGQGISSPPLFDGEKSYHAYYYTKHLGIYYAINANSSEEKDMKIKYILLD